MVEFCNEGNLKYAHIKECLCKEWYLMDICRKLFANVENWTEAKPRGTKGRMQKRTLVQNIAFVGGRHLLKPYQEEYLKNIRRISGGYHGGWS